jgi:hypothetical protein
LYKYETWSLILREEQRLGVFENKVLRRTSGPKREEVVGGWRRLHTKDLDSFLSSPNLMKVIKQRRRRRRRRRTTGSSGGLLQIW